MKIAIIGGGISGLSAAYSLQKEKNSGIPIEYTLFESAPRLGGVLNSEQVEDCLIEGGPDSFLTEKPWANQLCAELGIADDLIGSNDADRKTYILVNKRLIAMPDGLMFMVPTKLIPTGLSPLFSWGTKFKMLLELLHPPRKVGHDETVADMVRRHFGQELVDRLADPLLSGVYGGTADSLSVRAVLPRFVDMENKYGSLTLAMIDARRKLATMHKEKGSKPKPLFSSLKSGMQKMVDAVVARLDANSLHTSTTVHSIAPRGQAWEVRTENGVEHFDGVIVAVPARIASRMLDSIDHQLAEDLGKVEYSSSITMTLGYDMEQLKGLPPGFGFLVPRTEGTRMLACTFVHNKFPNRAPAGKGLLRCFMGGAHDDNILELSDQEITAIARRELKQILKLDAEPRFVRIYRWRASMAQYTPGHLERLERIDNTLAALPGLALAGNAFKGIGVPDCIRSGQDAAAKLAKLAKNTQTVQ
ncbi:MAG TPA: protoporphyrinogen oxidase [candidate division Zixibacteria bacterium]|nr:protoporphyrinogen oxidase [candidate division Zixibacteria bacterium]